MQKNLHGHNGHMQIFLFLKQTFSKSLNFFFFFKHFLVGSTDRYHSSYRLREDSCHEVMTDVLRFVFLELGRFKKRIWELYSVFDKWMYLLKHIHEMDSMPDVFRDPLFTRLFMLAKINNFTAQEYEQYKKSLENMSELDNIINSTAELAEMRGRAEGRAETIAQMLAGGIPEKTVAEALGITVEECRSYRKEQVL
jgi:predicted transposase/invertase (TIGR01784 family)